MKIKTIYEYESSATFVTVTLETFTDNSQEGLEFRVEHIEKLREILGIPNAPSDKEMEDMEEYFGEGVPIDPNKIIECPEPR